MLPIVIEMELPSWSESLMEFARRLREAFGRRLIRIIALPPLIYQSTIPTCSWSWMGSIGTT